MQRIFKNGARTERPKITVNKVIVFAQFKAKTEAQEQLKSILYYMAQVASNDRECLWFTSIQNEEDDTFFMLSVGWASLRYLENHLQVPTLSIYWDNRQSFLNGDPEVSRWRVIGG